MFQINELFFGFIFNAGKTVLAVLEVIAAKTGLVDDIMTKMSETISWIEVIVHYMEVINVVNKQRGANAFLLSVVQ